MVSQRTHRGWKGTHSAISTVMDSVVNSDWRYGEPVEPQLEVTLDIVTWVATAALSPAHNIEIALNQFDVEHQAAMTRISDNRHGAETVTDWRTQALAHSVNEALAFAVHATGDDAETILHRVVKATPRQRRNARAIARRLHDRASRPDIDRVAFVRGFPSDHATATALCDIAAQLLRVGLDNTLANGNVREGREKLAKDIASDWIESTAAIVGISR